MKRKEQRKSRDIEKSNDKEEIFCMWKFCAYCLSLQKYKRREININTLKQI